MEEGYTCMNGTTPGGSNGSSGGGVVSLTTSPTGGAVAQYSNQTSSDSTYLTPTSPSPSQGPPLPAFPPALSPPSSLHIGHGGGPRRKHYPVPRADSGIEADSPRSPTSLGPSASGSANPVSTVYEYIDPQDVRVQQMQQTQGHSTTQGESTSSGISSATTVGAYTGDVVANSANSANDGLRRRVNPMYEALEQNASRLYAQMCHCKMQSSTHRQVRYLWWAFLVMMVLIIFLLAVIAYILFMLVPAVKSRVYDQEDRLMLLETGYEKLYTENQQLLQIFAANDSVSQTSLAESMVDRLFQLNNSVLMFSSRLDEVSRDLHQQISNISLIPGPQGAQGVGNLSLCYYTSSTDYISLPGAYSTTSWLPNDDVLKDYMVMSATCGVIGGDEHFVEAQKKDPAHVKFRCRCDGAVVNYDRRACTIHIVLCPRLFSNNQTSTAVP